MKVVSFFAGCGGLDLGFEQADFAVVWANEFESHCRAIYLRNHHDTEFVLGDICKIDPNTIPDCDGFIGGPPCQSWICKPTILSLHPLAPNRLLSNVCQAATLRRGRRFSDSFATEPTTNVATHHCSQY